MIRSLSKKLSVSVERFPISVLFVIGFAVLFFKMIHGDAGDIRYQFRIFIVVGALISVTVTLFSEDYFSNLKTHGITFLAMLLWGVYCFFLPENAEDVRIGKNIEIFVIGGAAFLAMFFISFLKKDQDLVFWNFSMKMLLQIALACVFGAIFFGGLSLALVAVESLFGIAVRGMAYGDLAVICFVLLAPLYFLANIPDKKEKHNDEIVYGKALKVLALYILVPIMAVYAVILYGYLLKIIAAWELPNGWVSWLVSALALGGLLIIALLYPIREKNEAAAFISRWSSLLILPLLLLMTIGIFRRISDYGITVNRGYVLLLNVWFYSIYIYLFFTRSRHIKWILISSVVVFLLTSINVWGVASVTKNLLIKEVSAVFNKKVSTQEAETIFSAMTPDERTRIEGKLRYLYRNFGKKNVQPLFTNTLSDRNFLSEWDLTHVLLVENKTISYIASEGKMWQVTGYNTFMPITYYGYGRISDERQIAIKISAGNCTISVPLKETVLEYLATDEASRHFKDWIVRGNDYMVLIGEFSGNYYPTKDSIYVSRLKGYLFTNKNCNQNQK